MTIIVMVITIIAEVKRNPKKLDMAVLRLKAESIKKELSKYTVAFKGFSPADM
jgi:hypothetical protein